MLCFMKHKHYWISLKNQQKKFEKKQHSESSLKAIYTFRCYKFIHIGTSAGISKAITYENDCLWYLCFVLLFLSLGQVDLEPLHHLRWSSLWRSSTTGSYNYCYKEFHLIYGRGARSTSDKHRENKKETLLSFSSLWFSQIIFCSIMFWLILTWFYKVVVLTNIFMKNVYLQRDFVSTWRVLQE